jgi:hypothetical protein
MGDWQCVPDPMHSAPAGSTLNTNVTSPSSRHAPAYTRHTRHSTMNSQAQVEHTLGGSSNTQLGKVQKRGVAGLSSSTTARPIHTCAVAVQQGRNAAHHGGQEQSLVATGCHDAGARLLRSVQPQVCRMQTAMQNYFCDHNRLDKAARPQQAGFMPSIR